MPIELNERIDYCPNCTKTYWDYTTPWGPLAPRLYSDNPVWLIKKDGKYGEFFGCPNFPKCDHARTIKKAASYVDYEDELRPY